MDYTFGGKEPLRAIGPGGEQPPNVSSWEVADRP